MGKRNKNHGYDPDSFDDTAAFIAKASRRQAYLSGQTGRERPNAAGFHGPSKRQAPKRNRAASKGELRAWL